MLTAHPKPDEPLPMRGSVLVFHADTEAEVRKLLQDDIYTEAGVWDLSKVQIYPIKSGFRSAVPGSK